MRCSQEEVNHEAHEERNPASEILTFKFIFVFFAVSGVITWLVAIAVGAVVGAGAVIVAKSIGRAKVEEVPEDATDLAHTHAPTSPARPVTA